MSNVVFVTAHPDDESLWVGGLLSFLSKSEGVTPYVICMTGRDHPSRFQEFSNAMEVVGVSTWIVGDMSIPTKGGIPLSNIQEVFDTSLKELNLESSDIDLLVTHSFYGDEHEHLQHKQLFNHFFNSDIPFAFFSSMTLPIAMNCTMRDMKRLHNTHLINAAEVNCTVASHYLQFKVDEEVKKEMLSKYVSIGLEDHKSGYAAWDSYIEGIYFKNPESYEVFEGIINNMPTPGGPRTFLI
jgi:hypothetical protein